MADYGHISPTCGSNLDPNLAGASYRTFTFAGDATLTNYWEFWHTGSGDLANVAFASRNGYAGEISLAPAAGFGIRIISFDLAGGPSTDRTDTIMRLVDGSNNLLFDFATSGSVLIQGGNVGALHTAFAPNLSFGGTVEFPWGNDWNPGIDNQTFEVLPLSAIPEQRECALTLAGVAAIRWWRRRRSVSRQIPSGNWP